MVRALIWVKDFPATFLAGDLLERACVVVMIKLGECLLNLAVIVLAVEARECTLILMPVNVTYDPNVLAASTLEFTVEL